MNQNQKRLNNPANQRERTSKQITTLHALLQEEKEKITKTEDLKQEYWIDGEEDLRNSWVMFSETFTKE